MQCMVRKQFAGESGGVHGWVMVLLVGALLSAPGQEAGAKRLRGHVPPAAAQLTATGRLPSAQRLALAIGLPLRDEAGLTALLERLYDPAAPEFRHYLTPAEFTARFGPTEADYAAVARFAETHGLTVTARHANRLVLDVAGPVEAIQRAFQLTLRTYRHPTEGREFFAPDSEPVVAAALPVADISGLNNYALPHPKIARREAGAMANASPRTGSSPGGSYMGNDFRAAYLPGVTLTGAGQMVGLLQFDGFYQSDITAYETAAGLPAVPIQTVLLDSYSGTPTSSGNIEVSLDIEMVMSMAPGLSKIIVFEAGPSGLQNDILSAMVSNNQVKQFSCSWGWSGGPTTTTDNLFKQMATQGQSFFSASGDSDAFTVGASSANGVDNTSLANAPSSCPYITQVGGTTLATTSAGGAWASETVWNWGLHSGSYVGSSGGISSYYAIPTWQAGVSMAANGGSTVYRNIPDVAMTADNVYVLYGNGASSSVGGTSCAAPLWAGLAALINQQAVAAGRSTIGLVNSAVYTIGAGSLYAPAFHDITTGSNVWSSSPSAYYAAPGYDLCTGWGTPAGQNLINALAGVADSLGLSPAAGFTASGPVGGPFSVASLSVQLTNTSTTNLSWSLINTSAWLTASITSGALAGGAKTNLTLSLAPVATNLTAGTYAGTVIFTNLASHGVQGLSFTLQVIGQVLLTNGGFETGDFTGWTLVGNSVVNGRHGQPATIYNAVESASSYPLVVHAGNYGAFLGDVQLATISQTIPTIPGRYYLVSLWMDNPSASGTQQFVVRWNTNSASVNTIYSLTSPPALTWTNLQFMVLATSTSTVLQLGAENNDNYFGLDDISVTAIPPLKFQSAAPGANGLALGWSAAPGVVYQVEYRTNLLQTNWLALGSPITATNAYLTLSDTNARPTSPSRFYRLMASP